MIKILEYMDLLPELGSRKYRSMVTELSRLLRDNSFSDCRFIFIETPRDRDLIYSICNVSEFIDEHYIEDCGYNCYLIRSTVINVDYVILADDKFQYYLKLDIKSRCIDSVDRVLCLA